MMGWMYDYKSESVIDEYMMINIDGNYGMEWFMQILDHFKIRNDVKHHFKLR